MKLGEQWIEVIDGQEHMLKAVDSTYNCNGCAFLGGSGKCLHSSILECPVYRIDAIIKDLGILKDGLLQNCWGEYPKLKISADTKTDALFWYRYVTRERDDVFCMTEAYKSEQEAKDAWNRRA